MLAPILELVRTRLKELFGSRPNLIFAVIEARIDNREIEQLERKALTASLRQRQILLPDGFLKVSRR